jgi:hypothetical protein
MSYWETARAFPVRKRRRAIHFPHRRSPHGRSGSEKASRLHRRSLRTALQLQAVRSLAGFDAASPVAGATASRPPASIATRVLFIDSLLACRRLRTSTRRPVPRIRRLLGRMPTAVLVKSRAGRRVCGYLPAVLGLLDAFPDRQSCGRCLRSRPSTSRTSSCRRWQRRPCPCRRRQASRRRPLRHPRRLSLARHGFCRCLPPPR